MESLRDVLIEQLKDLYSAETQLVEALPKTAKECSTKELKKGIEAHLAETKQQIERLDKISQVLKEKLTGKTCQAMKGLIKEAEETIKEQHDNSALKDVMIIAIAQKIEHYEIAGYGNARALALFLKLDDIAALLDETLDEEKNADLTLSEVTQEKVLPQLEEDDDVEEEEEEDEKQDSFRS